VRRARMAGLRHLPRSGQGGGSAQPAQIKIPRSACIGSILTTRARSVFSRRISPAIRCPVPVAALLVSWGEQAPTIVVEPGVERACFDTHFAALPTGFQYAGIAQASPGRVAIQVPSAAELTTRDCALNPDGSLKRGGA